MSEAGYMADVLSGKRQWCVEAGDCRDLLKLLPDESVQCVVTSPPYWGLRDYGVDGQVGLEPSPQEYVAQMVEIFREVRRVLRSDGTCWLNLGDSYNGSGSVGSLDGKQGTNVGSHAKQRTVAAGLKPKDLIGIPWEVALALRNDGWWLRSDIVWAKPNPMPESVTDRPARSHEYIFLLTKSRSYYYDYEAVRRPMAESSGPRLAQDVEHQNGSARAHGGTKVMKAVRRTLAPPDANGSTITGGAHGRHTLGEAIPEKQRRTDKRRGSLRPHEGFNSKWDGMSRAEQTELGANLRDVWHIATYPFSQAHFATFPPKLIEPCIKAGTKPGDVVLDPFAGASTTGLVANRLGRRFIGMELNEEYVLMGRHRIYNDAPLLQEAW